MKKRNSALFIIIMVLICTAFGFKNIAIKGNTVDEDKLGTEAGENKNEFEFEGALYKVTDEKKHRVCLVKSRPLEDYDGKCYEQEAYVYNNEKRYSVYSIGYKAFSEDGINSEIEVKLPSTVRSLKSECMGANVIRLNLSETKIKTIPSYLFVAYEGIKDRIPMIEEIILPESCKKIASYAFQKCNNIKKIEIPEKITKIGSYFIEKTCTEITFKGKVPGGMVNQKMKKTKIYVKPEYYVDTLELMVKPVSLGKCEIVKTEKDID